MRVGRVLPRAGRSSGGAARGDSRADTVPRGSLPALGAGDTASGDGCGCGGVWDIESVMVIYM